MTAVMNARARGNRAMPRAQLRGRIFDAAIELYRRVGYDETTVDQIAQAAGVAKGTVFNFFATKRAILLAYYEALDARFRAALLTLAPDAPRAALVGFYGKAEALLRGEGTLVDAIVREAAVDATIYRADRRSGAKDRKLLAAYLRACQKAGSIGAHVDATVAGQVVADLWSATAQDWVRSGRTYSLTRRLAAKLAVLFAGLAPEGGPRRGR